MLIILFLEMLFAELLSPLMRHASSPRCHLMMAIYYAAACLRLMTYAA